MPEDTEFLAEALRRSVGNFVRAVRRGTGTSRTARSEALDLLDRHGPLNVAALAAARGVAHQTMRLTVAQLEAAGLVAAADHPSDGRSRLYALSAVGRTTVSSDRATRTDHIREMIEARLSVRERRQLAVAVALLDRLGAEEADRMPPISATPSGAGHMGEVDR